MSDVRSILTNLVARFRKRQIATLREARAEQRVAGQMIAGCEYELRQVARDVARTRNPRPTFARLAAVEPEPFAIEGRLRNPLFRKALERGI